MSGLALATALGATPASAETSAPAGPNAPTELEAVVVTARKVEENLQAVPVAVTAFTAKDIVRQNVLKVQDVARFVPGFTIRGGGSTPSAMTLTLRGQVQTDILATLDPSVGVYVDGVYWARAYGLNSDLLDVSGVQVLKGPQGTLFGRNTTGGALLITSNDPDPGRQSEKLSLTYGRFNEFNATGVVNLPIVTDKVAARIALQRAQRDGYTTNILTGSKLDNRNRWNARGKLLVEPTSNSRVVFSVEYFKMNERSPARELLLATPTYAAANSTYSTGSTAALYAGFVTGNPLSTATAAGLTLLNNFAAQLAANPDITASAQDPYARATAVTYGVTGAFDTDWGTVKAIGSYRKIDSVAGVELATGPSFPIHFTEGKQSLEQASGEVILTGKAFSGGLDFAAGVFAFHEEGFDQSLSNTVTRLNAVTSHFYGEIKNDSTGAYGQATWHATERLNFTGGLRYSLETKGLDSRNNNLNRTTGIATCSLVAGVTVASTAVNIPQCSQARSDSFKGISYTIGVDYRLSDEMMVYAKRSKGFRSGGQNLRAPSLPAFLPFQPEIAYSNEVGFKGQFFDNRVRLNLAAYNTTVDNIQRTTLVATAVPGLTATILGNAGKAQFNGAEAEVQAVVYPGLRLSATGAVIDPKYKRYADLSGDRSFERFGNVSKSSYTLAADYSTDLGNYRLFARVDWSWLARQPTDPYNYPANPSNPAILKATTTPAAGLLGARVAVATEDGRYELAIFGRNLTDNRDFNNNLIVAPLGYVSGVRREPVTYGVTLTADF